jgi:hypothetical protein
VREGLTRKLSHGWRAPGLFRLGSIRKPRRIPVCRDYDFPAMSRNPPPDAPLQPVLDYERALSPDKRRVARMTKTDNTGMFHEDISWFIEVTEADGSPFFATTRTFSGYVNDLDDHRAEGERLSTVGFDRDGNLLIGTSPTDVVETVRLPPALALPAARVRAACEAALRASWPEDRALALLDGVEVLLWPRMRACWICSPGGEGSGRATCQGCRGLCVRRIAAMKKGPLPEEPMVLAETSRALRAHSPEPDEMIAVLEAQGARIVEGPCTGCGQADPMVTDLRSPAGRTCTSCIEKIVTPP